MSRSAGRAGCSGMKPHSPKQMPSAALASFLANPLFRLELSHGTIAELAEGFRVLSGGRRDIALPRKDLFQITENMGLHITEEEFNETMRVASQGEQINADELTFTEFLHLMTCKVEDTMAEEMRSAFHQYDKNRTGFVTRKQFTEMFATMGERSSPEEVDELLLMTDVSETDDRINYNSFISELTLRLNGM